MNTNNQSNHAKEPTMTDVNDLLMGGGAPAAKFPTIGTTVVGTIIDTAVAQQIDPADGTPKTWKNGDPMMQAILTLQTDERDPDVEDDDGQRRLFVKGKSLRDAVRGAVLKSGAKGIEIGGRLAVQYKADGEKTNPAFNAPKLYVAQYEPPAPDAAAVNDLLGTAADIPQQPTATATPASSLL